MEGFHLVPAHLEELAHNIKYAKDSATFTIQCKCGCHHFDIYAHAYPDKERQQIEAYEQEIMKQTKAVVCKCI